MKKAIFFLLLFILIVFIPLTHSSEWVRPPITVHNPTLITNNYITNITVYNESGIWNRNGTIVSFINTGDTLNLSGSTLTNLGELIVTTITLKGNLTPDTTELYNIGSPDKWIANIWVKNIFAKEINSTNVTTVNLEAIDINTENILAKEGDIDNMTTSQTNYGNFIIKNNTQDLVVILA